MEKCFAIPLEGGKLSSHFGHCEEFAIIIVSNNNIVDYKLVTPPEHQPGLYPKWIASLGVTDVIAGGMGQKAINLFCNENINTFVGAPVKDAKSLVDDFLSNKLSLQANYCNHDNHNHGNCKH
ncbi:NifB/NifX family molybdenum-iron cluster-binding protein [Paludibacter sp.]